MSGDVRTEVDRLIAWIVATIEVERGIDATENAAMMNRIGEEARIAHAQRTRRFDIEGIEIVVSERQLAEIFSGKAKPPNVEQFRERRKREREGVDVQKTAASWLYVAIIVAVALTLVAGTFFAKHGHEPKDTHGEHR